MATKCKKCGVCCANYPCAMLPDDVDKIASFLNISIEKLFHKYLVIDYWEDSPRRYYLCPARNDNERGCIVSFGWAFSKSPCIFLENNLCVIHEVKPHMGKRSGCWHKRHRSKLWYTKKWKDEILKYLQLTGE